MIHLRVDNEPSNTKRRFACGIGPELPDGDKYIFDGELGLYNMVDCASCIGSQLSQLGTPISQLSGRPGMPGYAEFCRIAATWGYGCYNGDPV
jgi:hypothetical protein